MTNDLTDEKMAIAEKLMSDLCESPKCEDCGWWYDSEDGNDFSAIAGFCDNGLTAEFANLERSLDDGNCGPEAKLFEPRTETA